MVAAFLLGCLLGSFPAAWVLVRFFVKQDVSRAGSGNVGAFNALRVSKSAWIGVLVVLLDAGKGALAVWLSTRLALAGAPLHLQLAAAVGVVVGHDYNPWLSIARRRLAGGKGFAAAAGALLVFRAWLVPAWLGIGLVAWLLLRALRGITDEAPASAAATVLLVPAAWALYDVPTTAGVVALNLVIAPRLVGEVWGLLRG